MELHLAGETDDSAENCEDRFLADRGVCMGSIKVLYVLDKLTVGESHLHGVTRLCGWWIPEFDKEGFEVSAVTLRGRDAAGDFLEGLGIEMHYLGRSSFDPRAIPALLSLIRKKRIDLLHLHGYGATNFGRICALLLRIPCIVHEHIVDEHIPSVQRVADWLLSRATTSAIAISKGVREFMVGPRWVPRERVEVIYNGIPLDAYADDVPADSGWREAAGIPDHYRLVAIVGRLNELKGHRYFLDAAGAVAERHPDVGFVVVGDGELMDTLRAQASQLGIAERVFFLGHRDDVPDILRGSDISVVASLSEGGPLVLFEAMAGRCATLITETCGLAELIEEGRNGFVVPVRDSGAIAAKTLALLEDPDLSKEVAERGRQDAFTYDVRSTVARFENIYRKMVR